MDTTQIAIARSISHNEIVTVEVDDPYAALSALSALEYSTDSVETDRGIEVWGWTAETAEGSQDWRLLFVEAN
ncbi:MAG: hypothetical protein KAI66_05795 [Lentisphaeria bacterium]|nr:hypothetical protein [Lentisphaeria bacterium]